MTYNVHSCIGRDGLLNLMRIAKVIAQHDVNIVALQELDSGLMRTEFTEQAKLLANMLEMNHHFHPSFHIQAGRYGNAILSPHPMKTFRAGEIPTHPRRGIKEKRGAIWLKLDINGRQINVFNTHLGLNRHERLSQAIALSGPDWLRHPACREPTIFCGDLNTISCSGVYRIFRNTLIDVRSGATWPSRFPALRLDYIFVSPDIEIGQAVALKNKLTREASDHLPVLATLEVAS